MAESSVSQFLVQEIEKGDLRPDKEQNRIAKRLSRLQNALRNYDNAILFEPVPSSDTEEGQKSQESNIVTDPSLDNKSQQGQQPTKPQVKSSISRPQPTLRIPRGLYIFGDVGTGKTMLMDSFYSLVDVKKKKRFHFHSFLSQVHSVIHELKQQDLKEKGRNFSIDTSLESNPIYRVGLKLASELSLLCLDEFQVTDIADAVILSQLFSVLFAKGTVVVATSNRPPSDLYEGGINRGYFLPFIDLLQHHMIVASINSQLDYRKLLSSSTKSFFVTPDVMETMLTDLIKQLDRDNDGGTNSVVELDVGFHRTLTASAVYGKVNGSDNSGPIMAQFSFDELCNRDIGAMEYRAIAKQFDIIVLQNVPYLSVSRHNIARRFITLIDELYEGRCALLCSSEASSPKYLFRQGSEQPAADGTDGSLNGYNGDVGDMRDLDIATQGGTPIGALASVRELAFAFERASSRLIEMCSESWWNRHVG